MTDDDIDTALTRTCDVCGVGPGDECVHVVSGLPLLESLGMPVHDRRIDRD